MSLTDRQIRDRIWQASWQTQGRAPTDADYRYWIGKWPELEARGVEVGDPDYAMNRLLGKGATGADAPPFGEFAKPPTPYRDVPPSPWTDAPTPGAPPAPPAPRPPTADPPAEENAVLALLVDSMERIVAGVETITAAAERSAAAIEQLAARGVKVRF